MKLLLGHSVAHHSVLMHLYCLIFIIFITYRDRFVALFGSHLREYVVGSPECELGSSLARCRCRFFEGPFRPLQGSSGKLRRLVSKSVWLD